MKDKRELTYFTTDGWYGDAEDLVIYDTTAWSEGQWIDVQRSAQDRRFGVAKQINQINELTQGAINGNRI